MRDPLKKTLEKRVIPEKRVIESCVVAVEPCWKRRACVASKNIGAAISARAMIEGIKGVNKAPEKKRAKLLLK